MSRLYLNRVFFICLSRLTARVSPGAENERRSPETVQYQCLAHGFCRLWVAHQVSDTKRKSLAPTFKFEIKYFITKGCRSHSLFVTHHVQATLPIAFGQLETTGSLTGAADI
jgi:hypothetical protein